MTHHAGKIKGAVQQRPCVVGSYIVGLTGGIASGKSTVSRYLYQQHAIPIIDTDIIARELVEPGSTTLRELIVHFGQDIVDEQGHLKRRLLREIISANPAERWWLNNLMHPRIYTQVKEQLAQLSASAHPYIIIVIPLLNSSSPYLELINDVWVIDCDVAQQKQHLMQRDQMSELSAQQLIDAQPSRTERLALATRVVVNDGDVKQLIERSEAQHQQLISSLTTHTDPA